MGYLSDRVCLHLGCGDKSNLVHPLFRNHTEVRMDIDPAVEPDIVCDILDIKWESGTADAVYCSHTIEHLRSWDVPVALKEIHRVLKQDANAILIVPDILAVIYQIQQGRLELPIYTSLAGPITGLDILYGYQPACRDNPFMEHHMAFTSQTLADRLKAAGFSKAGVHSENGSLVATVTK